MHLVDVTMFYDAEGGGVSTYLNAKSHWLAQQRGVRHTIVSPGSAADASSRHERIAALALPGMHGFRMPLSSAAITRRLIRLRPALVEAGDAGPCAWAALRASSHLGIPAIAFYHSDLTRLMHNRFGSRAAQWSCRYLAQLYARFDLVLAPSRLMVEQLRDIGVASAVHQPLGIDCTVFHPSRRDPELRQRLGISPKQRLLVYAGRFTADKKLDVLLQAKAQLGPDYHLLLVGGGAELSLPPDTTLLPFQRDQAQLARILASCDLLVHPGDSETFGLIVIEAMGCALPVVATRAGGVVELVDEETGMLAEPNCPLSLAATIEQIWSRDLRAMGEQARRKVEQHFAWDQVFPQLMGRYMSLMAHTPPLKPALLRRWRARHRAFDDTP